MRTSVLIIEDEAAAATKLQRQLKAVDADIFVSGICASVIEGIEFLENQLVDLIISDIHLSDGLAFEIFKEVGTDVPIIFTTAYDQYAIEAFKTNSMDYLLKPVKKIALEEALQKFKRLNAKKQAVPIDFNKLIDAVSRKESTFKERFLLETPKGDFRTIAVSEIAYFYAEGKYTFAVSRKGKRYFSKDNLSSIIDLLNPVDFFLLNRKFIAHIESIGQIIKYSKSRLKIKLIPPTEDEVIISTEKAPYFKKWLGQ